MASEAIHLAESRPATPWWVACLTWPLILLGGVGTALWAIRHNLNYGITYGAALGAAILLLVLLEAAFPAQPKWRMTLRSFLRDVKYLLAGSASLGLINGAFGLLSIKLGAGHPGPMTSWPLYVAVPVALFVVDFINYWIHRWSHELPGALGAFLWRSHAPHHLPPQVYVFMHVAGHPINLVLVRGLAMILPLYALGATPETLLLFNVVNGFQGLVSHTNLDLRAGWFNYVLTGVELHRFHHSADGSESKNFAVTLPILDLLFGTFSYQPGRLPDRLGVDQPTDYPDANDFWKVMALPFQGSWAPSPPYSRPPDPRHSR